MIIDTLFSAIQTKQLILLGEMHGTKEIPELFAQLFSQYAAANDFDVCMEIPANNQRYIDHFFRTGDDTFLKQMPFFSDPELNDGRNSREYFNFIITLRKISLQYNRDIRISCIDVERLDSIDPQNQREKTLADNILKTLTSKKLFAILGAIHASKQPLTYQGIHIVTAGSLLTQQLKSHLLSIHFMPSSGSAFNIRVQPVERSDKNLEKNFDITCDIGKISPCTFLKD